jgi:tRNA modification GTPase
VRMEAVIDFSDDDVADLAGDDLHQAVEYIVVQLRDVLGAARRGQRLREGMIVAIAGQPNVGKSTLLNRLAGAEVAIVTDIAGTTRDVLREDVIVDGLPLTVVDMAGLRETIDPVEQEGVRRAWRALEQAELILFLVDDGLGPTDADETLLQRLPCGTEIVVVRNKCDLSGRAPAREADQRLQIRLSAQTGAGIELLVAEIKRVAGLASGTQGLFSARTRHVVALERALAHALEIQRQRRERGTIDVLAEELRLAQNALGEVTGAFTSEDLLGAIFSRFCIGK